jgi:uncharacterized protein YebE (UPF0316 family)
MNPDVFAWIIVPLLIFLARVADVTIGTLRIVFVSRGRRRLAPVLGFVEVLIWTIAISQIMKNLDNPVSYVAYAAGFAAGTFVGLYVEDKLAIGTLIVRVIMAHRAGDLIERLHAAQYGVTSVDAHGATGNVNLIYTVIKRKDLAGVMAIVHAINPKAFLSVEEVRTAKEGIFPPASAYHGPRLRLFPRRKGK